jgi:ubiquinone/menaquinone biosynthesis C-methylase UbiE
VVDLGCGSGRDCYLLAQVVGPNGLIIGIDMTDEQLEVARKHVDYHTKKFNLKNPNVDFRKGWIEDLTSANLEDNSVDVVISRLNFFVW